MGYALSAAAAYAAIDPSLTSPARGEAMVFADVTRRLEAVFGDDRATASRKAAALHDNRRLWRAAAEACAGDDNAMPEALRVSLLGLAGFVERHTSQVLEGSGEAAILCEINRRVAAGLSAGAA
ncbi:flagellar biosynthesis regulator FlaF [Jannaschia sp. S6380]|uniref:flagellar biosynthesis regulator FlaF n=1 Tax=Jannaschia sp. S6380 TaxID=2926408 RepID=UPI001FF4C87F|nr:flagellar biosynthesis regulator FlaF [Jannaschia sp. S6380]MCK0168269.1 flagellar biosynthesis regulator FlaF [Jannaschia sp. S6380]